MGENVQQMFTDLVLALQEEKRIVARIQEKEKKAGREGISSAMAR